METHLGEDGNAARARTRRHQRRPRIDPVQKRDDGLKQFKSRDCQILITRSTDSKNYFLNFPKNRRNSAVQEHVKDPTASTPPFLLRSSSGHCIIVLYRALSAANATMWLEIFCQCSKTSASAGAPARSPAAATTLKRHEYNTGTLIFSSC